MTAITVPMSANPTIRVEQRPDGVAIVTFDVPGQPHNTLAPDMLAEFEQQIGNALAAVSVKAIVLCSGKPDSFIAGADLKVLDKMTTEAQASELSRKGNELLSKLANSPKPVVAAVHGAALGGGLEVALACHYILASDDPQTVLGLPEVMLGLLPGGGGTQRLVRRVGLVAALPMLLTGQRIRARKALRMGLVDQLTTPGGIAETAARVAKKLADGTMKPRRRKKSLLDRLTVVPWLRGKILQKARAEVDRKTRGLYPAPKAILECVETGLRDGMTAGLACEARWFGKLVVSPQASSLVRIFHWQNELKKAASGAEPKTVKRVAVLGGGFMGAGIASVSVGSWPVVVRDLKEEVLGSAAKSVHEGLEKQLRSGAITRSERDRRWSRLSLTTEQKALRGCDLVIEAVFENLELKRRVLAEAEAELAPDAVFASNTSAIPITEIAARAKHPERVLGMHYFSPVPKMPLLEIVQTAKTAPWAVETARAVGIAQGKTVIVVRDGPGFYTSRILAPFLNEAMVLLDEGARIEDLDNALRDFGFPVGPIALLDEVGIDVGAHVAKDLGPRLKERDGEPSTALPKLYEAGYHGRKNGRGFYTYPAAGKKGRKQVNPEVYGFFGGAERKPFGKEELQDRMALLMVNEAVHCLQEGILAEPRDGDIGAVFGLGFPPFHGGPFRYVDARGVAAVVAQLEQFAAKHGKRFVPAQLLKDHAVKGRPFYPATVQS